jgi:hypothetical protein
MMICGGITVYLDSINSLPIIVLITACIQVVITIIATSRLNSWGPFMSWRQQLWREWFYVQGDLNYFNDHREDRSHYVSTFVRLEALF